MTISAKTFTARAAAATLGLAAFRDCATRAGALRDHRTGRPCLRFSGAYGCYWKRQRVLDSWGWHVRRVRVCV
jgi:hypothetical protein